MIAWNNVELLVDVKKFCGSFGPNGPKSDLKLVFSPFSQLWFFSFPLSCIRSMIIFFDIAQDCSLGHLVELKLQKKKKKLKLGLERSKSAPKWSFLPKLAC